MGIVIALILLPAAVYFLSVWSANSDEKKLANAKINTVGWSCVAVVLLIVMWAGSYSTHLTMVKTLATIEQYQQTVIHYADKGTAEFKRPAGMNGTGINIGELTDLKYNHYQDQIGKMLREMRDEIVSFNTDYAGKKELKENWLFSWCIYLSDDMKLLKMEDYLK